MNFGLIGLGVMGQNLALNVEEHGYSVAVWNLETEWTDRFVAEHPGKKLLGAKTLEEFVGALERPRLVFLMITAGKPVDLTVARLLPLLEPGDVIIDGGNSWYLDTERRQAELAPKGIHFLGCGVSGGAEGARRGPSMMPGGPREAYEATRPIFEAIAARSDSGPCVTYVGPGGSGHFVKMVHNGIEYGDMQLIAETYDLLARGLGFEAAELASLFAEWNRGPLESFLIELTAKIFTVNDEGGSGQPLVDLVLDAAGQKGTGKWTAQVALDLGVPVPTISAAIDARFLSALKEQRLAASHMLNGAGDAPKLPPEARADLAKAAHDALYAAKICAYAQGMSLIAAASAANKWDLNLSELARIWKAGCIIRARFLDVIRQAYQRRPDLSNLLVDESIGSSIVGLHGLWPAAITMAAGRGVPVPALGASLSYFDAYRSAVLPANLVQAQRDAFGAHTYVRADHPERGAVHTDWLGLAK
jgi:6-phosphogluconate dehydrogenase